MRLILDIYYSGIPISRTLIFSNLPITRTKSRSLSSVKHCNFTPDFSNSPISPTNLRFPWRFKKSGFHCIQVASLSILFTQLHVVCLFFEVLFTTIFLFFQHLRCSSQYHSLFFKSVVTAFWQCFRSLNSRMAHLLSLENTTFRILIPSFHALRRERLGL